MMIGVSVSPRFHCARLKASRPDPTGEVERVFWHVVVDAIENLAAPPQRIGETHRDTLRDRASSMGRRSRNAMVTATVSSVIAAGRCQESHASVAREGGAVRVIRRKSQGWSPHRPAVRFDFATSSNGQANLRRQ